jgi:glycosyltransferase involved in cell wall biosynthesis
MSRVCFVTTTPFIANAFLRPHLLALATRHEITLATNMKDGYGLDPAIEAAVKVAHVPMARRIAPLRDIRALAELKRLLAAGNFQVMHSVAPKAGLLGVMAAYSVGVPVRIHTYQGEVWASRRGPLRGLLKAFDRIVGAFASHVLVVSRGEQAFLEAEEILPPKRSTVLGAGSIAGVDLARFRPDADRRAAVRRELGLANEDLVVMYVGRVTRDKGVLDLARAFRSLSRRHPQARLVMVGPDEGGLARRLRRAGAHLVGNTPEPERYLAAADIVCLPSYREGFGVALIEAGACAVPVLASRLYGTQDAVVEGVTGLFHEAGNAEDLEKQLAALAADRELRRRMGQAGRARVEAEFRQEVLVQALIDYYAHLLP